MNSINATITIKAQKEGSEYSIDTQLSHANGLKVLVYVMELMDIEQKAIVAKDSEPTHPERAGGGDDGN